MNPSVGSGTVLPAAKPVKKKVSRHQAEKNPAPRVYAVALSEATSELVRWYCSITHHRPEIVVEGIVFQALENARCAYEEPCPENEAFNMVLEDTLEANMQQIERPPALLSELIPCGPPHIPFSPRRKETHAQ